MTYSVLRTSNENHDIFYCVGINDEPMTNPTHSAQAARQARDICERYKLQGQYSINMWFRIDSERKAKEQCENSKNNTIKDPYGESTDMDGGDALPAK